MYIEELSSKSSNKYATVTMSYDDIKNISNALFSLIKNNNLPKDTLKKYEQTYTDCKQLFDLVKEGKVQRETIIRAYECINEKEEDISEHE